MLLNNVALRADLAGNEHYIAVQYNALCKLLSDGEEGNFLKALFYLVTCDVAGFDINQISSCEEVEISKKATSFGQ